MRDKVGEKAGQLGDTQEGSTHKRDIENALE